MELALCHDVSRSKNSAGCNQALQSVSTGSEYTGQKACLGVRAGGFPFAPLFPLPLHPAQETSLCRPHQGHLWLLAVLADGEPGRKTVGGHQVESVCSSGHLPPGHLRLAETSTSGQCSSPGNLLCRTMFFQVLAGLGIHFRWSVNLERKNCASSSHVQHCTCCRRRLRSVKFSPKPSKDIVCTDVFIY